MEVNEITFTVTFTSEELIRLKKAAEHHYDHVCKTFSKKLERTMHLNWRNFDILAKICESELVPDNLSDRAWKLFAELRDVAHRCER